MLCKTAQEVGLDADEAISAACEVGRISDLRARREEADRTGVPGVPTVATADEMLHYGAASPGKIRELLARQRETVG